MTHPCDSCCYWKGDSMWKGSPCSQGWEPGSCAKPWQRCPFCEQAFTDDKCLSDALARIAALEAQGREREADGERKCERCELRRDIAVIEARAESAEAECERLRGLIGICDAHKTLNYVLDGGCEACDKEYAIKRAALAAGKG